MAPPPGDRIEIASSRTKLVLMIAGALAFTAGGALLFVIADTRGPVAAVYIKGVSVLAIAFFGLCMIYGLVKLFDSAPGLVLDREGLIDNSSAIAAGRVPWREIRDVLAVQISRQRMLAFVVEDPQKYLARGNFLHRFSVRMNYRIYGTPIFISAHSLKLKFEDLEALVRDMRRRHGSTITQP